MGVGGDWPELAGLTVTAPWKDLDFPAAFLSVVSVTWNEKWSGKHLAEFT